MLVQDYHFALLPRMIREALPAATIITFWHIPWPNPEAFAICPWREELLDGLLGSSILGFHTQFHCNNFVDTVDRQLEARVDRETFTVSYRGAPDRRQALPDLDRVAAVVAASTAKPVDACRRDGPRAPRPAATITRSASASTGWTTPRASRSGSAPWNGCSSCTASGSANSPSSRSRRRPGPASSEYQHYEARVRAMATRINGRFADASASADHPAQSSITSPKRSTSTTARRNVCVVSSLHDGMNLVAKEFVSARDDERGVLVLSQFTGAARELPEAIIVNPYDTDECARRCSCALSMPAGSSAPACG